MALATSADADKSAPKEEVRSGLILFDCPSITCGLITTL